jgi:hypothetical protein
MSAPRHSADSYRDVLLDLVAAGAPTHAEAVRRRSLGAGLLDLILAHDREAQRLARLDAAHAAAFDPQPDPLSHRCGSDAHGHQGVA